MTALVLPAVAIGVSVVSAATDALRGRIPNVVTLTALVLGLACRAWFGKADLIDGLLGCVVAGSPPWLMHCVTHGKAIGGGDVKLFGALGALNGATLGLEIETSAVVVLGVFVLVKLSYQGRLCRVVGSAVRLAINPFLPKRWQTDAAEAVLTHVRMGPAIALATMTTLVVDRWRPWIPWL